MISTESYETNYQKYLAALAWMRAIGVDIERGRTAHYEKILGYWKDAYRIAPDDEVKDVFPDFVSSVFEIDSFIKIHEAFGQFSVSLLEPLIHKLNKGVKGPIDISNETSKSTTARNYIFEVAVAARLHMPIKGVDAILDTPTDTGVKYENKKIWIECKRVTRASKLEANIKDASKQLETQLSKKTGSGHRGMVALDVTKIITAGDEILVAKDDSELLKSIQNKMDAFIEEYTNVWEGVYKRRSPKIIGTIVNISLMASSENRNLLVTTSEWGLNPREGIPLADRNIQDRLATCLH